jgi:16S rRNA processing protein RimM
VAERICVARIGAPHGIRGEVRLRAFTADPMAVAHYGALESEDGKHSFEIEAIRPAKDTLVVRFKGIADRTAAEKLRNLNLFVPRGRLPAPQPDEFYHADLVGLVAVTADGVEVATVVAVQNFGAGDLLELRPAGRRNTVLLPFTAQTVPVVDIAGGRIVVDPPQGWLKD